MMDVDLGLTYLEDQRLAGFRICPLYRERYVLLAKSAESVDGRTEMSWAEARTPPRKAYFELEAQPARTRE